MNTKYHVSIGVLSFNLHHLNSYDLSIDRIFVSPNNEEFIINYYYKNHVNATDWVQNVYVTEEIYHKLFSQLVL